MPLYQSTYDPISGKTLRKAKKKLDEKDRELIEQQGKRVVNDIKARGGRFGETSADEVLAKIGMLLIAEEKGLTLDLRHFGVVKKLVE